MPREEAPAWERAMMYRENAGQAREKMRKLEEARDREPRRMLKRALGLQVAIQKRASERWLRLAAQAELTSPEALAFRRESEELVDPYHETILFPPNTPEGV